MSPPKPTVWFFYNSEAQIDDPLEFMPTTASSAATKRGPAPDDQDKKDELIDQIKNEPTAKDNTEPLNPPIFATVSFTGSLNPVSTAWTAFNPNDNAALEARYQAINEPSSANDPANESDLLLVGHKQIFGVSCKQNILKPVYWKSVRDTAHVKRSQWYFTSTLTPLDTSLEEALTTAFAQIRPWTQEYILELRSALEVPDALNKLKVPISYTLNSGETKKITYNATVVFAPCYNGPLDDADGETRPSKYPLAYLFTPYLGTSTLNPINLLTFPTTSQLVLSLLSGKTPPGVAQTLQQHFSWKDWKALRYLPDRPSDTLGYITPPVTQLVLVIHGIGQKLSERVDSFNFTYAINGFNVLMTELMDTENVKQYLTENANILALPVNWRRTLDFDAIKIAANNGARSFTLDQITMKSIPSVRGIVTDVILDIPFYMSAQPKAHMVNAAIAEANRIYTLFTSNNPKFESSSGRTHIIAHSLGSAIAMDILSTQPTDVLSPDVEIDDKAHFVFNTHNLFLAGSPAAFFLLLHNSQLTARADEDEQNGGNGVRHYGNVAAKNVYNILHHSDPISYLLNPTVDAEYAELIETAVLPGAKSFPVIKNDIHGNSGGFFDSIRSKVFGNSNNGSSGETSPLNEGAVNQKSSVPRGPLKRSFLSGEAIDSDLLEAIERAKDAKVSDNVEPSLIADEQLETYLSSSSLSTPGNSSPPDLESTLPTDPIELEERDFRSLKVAEKRMYQLNPNGQIDYVIPLQGGPLDNQYLSMLTAHSGYWENKDFARLVALECGRRPGVKNALGQYAVKVKQNRKK